MKELISKSAGFNRIEFWVASTIFVFIIFFFITDGLEGSDAFINAPYKPYFDKERVRFNFYTNYFVPQLIRYIFLFLAFLYLNFIIVPKLLMKKVLMRNVFLLAGIFLIAVLVFGITNTHLKEYLYKYKGRDEIDQAIFQDSFLYTLWLLFIFSIYTAIKYFSLYLLSNSEAIHLRYGFVRREGIAAFVTWIFGLFLIILGKAEEEIILAFMLLIPFGILLYQFAFYRLIPKSINKKYPLISYMLQNVLVLAVAFVPVMLLLFVFINDELAFTTSFLNSVFQLFITAPVTWVLYKRRMKGNEEIFVLKKELKQSSANIDFLRSQINPHFLFNALNTIYGTAIQEKAERTSEGIEKLGDMMRFMLQENMQEKISLAREIEYLNNYIYLQRLRTDPNPVVKIEAHIEHQVNLVQIAPMLLIPFVENAFKHGISFREPSLIKITLEVKDNTLYFDVYNSKHIRPEHDPEKDKSGIGLKNVKQRLQLLYPAKHELIIRENGKEFFVHLTIKLS